MRNAQGRRSGQAGLSWLASFWDSEARPARRSPSPHGGRAPVVGQVPRLTLVPPQAPLEAFSPVARARLAGPDAVPQRAPPRGKAP